LRFAILTDIHGNLPALEAVIADAEAEGCTHFVNLGDSLSGPLWPNETAKVLMTRDWPTIAGNHERQLLTLSRDRMGASDAYARDALDDHQLAWLASLPATLQLSSQLFLCHGTPNDDLEHFLYSVEDGGLREATDEEVAIRTGHLEYALILCGHTHMPRRVELIGGGVVANPGSVGLQAYDDNFPEPYRTEMGDPRARYAIIDHLDVEFRTIDYDFNAAANRAAENGQADWAFALRTGRMT
jgi:predicted phosphodiesterase